ncbi:MAG: hypothetical protein WBQ09_12635 [Terriglobales bacterium]
MDFVTKQFIVLAKKLRQDLRKGVSSLHNYLENERNATRDYRKAQDAKSIPQITLSSLPYGVEVRKTAADKRADEKYQNKYLRVQRLTVVLIAAYAGIAALQWMETIRATDANEKAASAAETAAKTASATLQSSQSQWRLGERPYLWPSPRGGAKTSGASESPQWETMQSDHKGGFVAAIAVDIKNSGRSPAIEVLATETQYFIGPSKVVRKQASSFVPNYRGLPFANIIPTVAGITPKSAVSPITQEQAANLVNGSWEWYIVGGIRYRDIFMPRIDPYETTYCWRVNPSGMPFGACEFGDSAFHTAIK